MYRVFLGAPTLAEIKNDPTTYSWRTVSSKSVSSNPTRALHPTQSLIVLPLATLEEASRRISLIYKDIVFNEGPEEESFVNPGSEQGEPVPVEVSVFRGVEQTTLFSWPPSRPAEADSDNDDSRDGFVGPSFLLDSSSSSIASSALHANSEPPQSPPPDSQASGSEPGLESRFLATQEPESQSFGNYSDASSIARFPSFHFNLHSLTSLTSLVERKFKGSIKVSCLLAVLEVEGPDSIHIKKGADAGKEVSIFKIVLGDEDSTVCKLTAWREVAEDWGGSGVAVAAKRGDIVHIENVMATCDPATSITLSASPYLKSQLVICYRTMPYSHEDGRLRPDLRLGISEPSVRKVAAVVQWFEDMAGLQHK
ncbi:hypothetical protein CVT25_002643 [Psilocybe cyanescens]|uniref:Shieldin complex subunit 2 first OB fold domain-containing protein n=1 Tax=Psilocybe cyanescens TaxID=93625 RepID=A0A409WLD9_PSICY|nr:hypothetical protein CVT25_002643 [Psilocybe cyanescens]